MTLTGTSVLGPVAATNATTDATGLYSFANLLPGTYTLTETQPAGYFDGKDAIGSQGGTAGNDVLSNIVLAANVNGVQNNFGEQMPPAGVCALAGGPMTTSKAQVKWPIRNNGAAPVMLDSLALIWPQSNGMLVKVKLDGDVVYDTPDVPWTASGIRLASGVGNFTATASKKTIAAGATRVLVFEFQNNAVSDSTQYKGTLWFGSCYLGFPSAGSALDVPVTPFLGGGVQLRVAPNPFSGTSSISYAFTTPAPVTLSVYDVHGRKLLDLVRQTEPAGVHTVLWSGRDQAGQLLPAGTYFVRLDVSGKVITRKLQFLR